VQALRWPRARASRSTGALTLAPVLALSLTLLLTLLAVAPRAGAQVAPPSATSTRPIAVSELVEFLRLRFPTMRVIAQVRANCLAAPLTSADEQRLRAAGADDKFVADVRASCVASNQMVAAVDSSGGMITPRVQQMQRSCERGAVAVCDSVADLYIEGIFAPKSRSRAADFLLVACSAGREESCVRAVDILAASAEPRDHQKAAQVLTQRCDVGVLAGCRRLGGMYAEGRGVPKDGERAVALYRRACDGNDAEACVEASAILVEGKSVAPDSAAALGYLVKACERGAAPIAAEHCAAAGASLARAAVPADDARAVGLLQRGCDAGTAARAASSRG